ncbi:MAG TPA: sulfurtransferase [Acidimicrobiia bacterium]|nr:sulfurtransferase [Acidimicrobiia bacterium]
MHPLISAEKLATVMDDVQICDIRWDLTDPTKGRQTYRQGHIPGAVFVDLDSDLSAPPGRSGRHPLPSIEEFAATLGRLGIDPATRVVTYDDVSGQIAARLWWMLRSIGHEEVQVLDGGLGAWVDRGGSLATGDVTPEPTRYPVPAGFTGTVSHDDLGGRTIIDARAGERYRGEHEPVDPKAGHIPGAINIPTSVNLDHTGRFLSSRALSEVYDEVADDVAVSCGSGVNACHDALAMVLAGRAMPEVYVGSFSEWSRRDKPVATGPHP